MRIALFLFLAALVTGAHAVSPFTAADAVDEEAIQGLAARFTNAYNARDFDALAEALAQDAQVVTTAGITVSGREAIRAQAQRAFLTPGPRPLLRVGEWRVQFQSRDVASIEGGTIFCLARKERGRWLITHVRDLPADFTKS